MLKKGARDFFEKECPKSLVRQMAEDEKGNPAELWQKMAQTRLAGLDVPGEVRRQRRNMIDLIALEEEMGRAFYQELSSPPFCLAGFLF